MSDGAYATQGWVAGRYLAEGGPARADAATTPPLYNDGHGPDTWQVHDVAADDVLNVRMGPGTDYPVIGSFSHNQSGLRQTTCVPFMTYEQSMNLSPAERESLDLPPRWCLMSDADDQTRGWVAGRYLMEGGTTPVTAPSETGTGDDMIDTARALVLRLYETHDLALRGETASPLRKPRSYDFFNVHVADRLEETVLQSDPLYDAQDFSISDLEVTALSMFRGMITIDVSFRNFGEPQQISYSLRADTQQEGAPVRIFRIDYPHGWFE